MAAVDVERDGGVAVVRLARPRSLNALDVPLLEGLVAALRGAQDAAVVILEGEGRAFCVGEDLKATLAPEDGGADELRRSFDLLQETTRLLTRSPFVAIAGVAGYAIGGGAELALAADLIVAEPGTRFRFPEVELGHAVTGGVTARLAAAVGIVRAKDMLLTSRWVDAHEALATGMVNEVVPDHAARTRELASELAARPRRSLAATKTAVELAVIPHQDAVMAAEVTAALHCFDAPDAARSVADFAARKRSLPNGDR